MKPGFAIVVLLLAVYAVQSRIDERFGAYRSTEEILYIDNPGVLKKVLMGFDSLAADLYWLRTVQYYGGKRRDVTNKDFDLLEPLLRITVALDPDLRIAYTYGATFLSEPFPQGAGTPAKGIALIDEGIRRHPEHWRFYLDKGFLYFWYLKDYQKAAEIFLEGSQLEGAPFWMKTVAGRALTQGGDRETARGMWQILHDTAETPQQQGNAAIHLKHLDALDQIDALRRVVALFEERAGRYPSSWADLVSAGLLSATPIDPTGAPYVLDAEKRDVVLSPKSALGRLPSH
jgi:hypothetical protein